MRKPSARMAPHSVTITHNHFGADQDGGMRVDSASNVANLPCFVQPGIARTIVDTSDETGDSRVTEFNPTKIYFLEDANLTTRDLISWVDHVGRTHNYQVVGYIAPATPFAQWRAECQEKI